ncbi:MAG TPA: anthranilate phosphoribosyltransferase [Chthonomonadales bacterium]|nr:anthranilate phosphoribosyltransferase [Chthonomonadales bacterium]
MIRDILQKLVEGEHLTEQEAVDVMTAVMEGQTTHAQIGALLAALRAKRETVDELTGFARVMRAKSVRVYPNRRPLIDTCGTGGDMADTFNISTAAAFVVASAGIAVAKHGNRAVSGRCGSADVLSALGVELALTPQQVADCIDRIGVGFMFAPHHHPAMQEVALPRRELGIRTVFNMLGPLTNPAGATRQLIGVFDPELCPKLAETLGRLGCERAMVVHGMDGLDEISTIGPTRISLLQNGHVDTDTLVPADFNLLPATLEDIHSAPTVEENAALLRRVLEGEHGPRRDIVAVNAAAGLILGGMAEGWREGVALAHRLLDSGRPAQILQDLIEFTQRCVKDERTF